MTSGAISGFFDIALNFNAQEFSDDNLVGQLAAAGWKMVMYGDETWLRLFPNTFTRHDGVSSFYVKDTVEVDRNVTRHLELELMAEDWDLLVLHYLGLDHVGHLGGRSSPLMPAKLKEMDEIIQHLHTSLISNSTTAGCRRTLLVVVSDHGMTDGGNHGGASPQETDALALFAGAEKFSTLLNYSDEVSQVDLAPTLALLLGVPIPLDSVGVLLVDLFSHLTAREKLRALEINSWHLLQLLRLRSPKSSCFTSICSNGDLSHTFEERINEADTPFKFCSLFLRAQKLHQAWRQQNTDTEEHLASDSPDWRIVYEAYISFLRDSSTWLARGMTEFLVLVWIGACGHYRLGNTNTLATVDVAGAYIGLTSHSIVLSGLLSFMITYASPILFALGMILVKPTHCIGHIVNEARNGMSLALLEMIALPCAVLLALNGVEVLASTVVMFLMKDHLFVWSVFAPKYLYVCASTVCTCSLVFVITFANLSTSLVICRRIR